MYAKVFTQIFDSSIADNYKLRHFFMDLLVLADINGVVDMTPAAIAGRTRIPIEEVHQYLAFLESPDTESRTPDHEGRRIVRLDEHRTWGWCILNYDKFRAIASEDQRKALTRERVRKHREKRVTPSNADVTPCNACNATQTEKQTEKQKHSNKASKPWTLGQRETAGRFEVALNSLWRNDAGKWVNRIRSDPDKSVRVIAEVESAIKEQRITTTSAQYAEDTWARFVSH